jgi:hypothetical protein
MKYKNIYVHDFLLMFGFNECTFVQPLLHDCHPQDHKCFTIVDHFRGRALGQILQGQQYLSFLATFAQASLCSQSLKFQVCVRLEYPNGTHLVLWVSMCNFVQFIRYFYKMPLHP